MSRQTSVTSNTQHTEITRISEIAEICSALSHIRFLSLYHVVFCFQIQRQVRGFAAARIISELHTHRRNPPADAVQHFSSHSFLCIFKIIQSCSSECSTKLLLFFTDDFHSCVMKNYIRISKLNRNVVNLCFLLNLKS